MDLIWSILIGALAGWLAGQVMKGEGYGALKNILLGMVGGVVGGLVFGFLGITPTNLIGRLLMAVVGAVVLIALARALRK
ncbi:MAG: GlsB/YeaQ/YmgE family stress response membrane protein [Flavobacteriales bacterium]|nr:GlsB/YeaQ/YmgE family stress response membrane protein [Flavobacteriales bacterium]